MYKNDGYVRRYSESFKLKVLEELAKGWLRAKRTPTKLLNAIW
jgi:hypothetical protein